jgi:hypothetical protein
VQTATWLGRIRRKPGCAVLIPGKEGYFYKLNCRDTRMVSRCEVWTSIKIGLRLCTKIVTGKITSDVSSECMLAAAAATAAAV